MNTPRNLDSNTRRRILVTPGTKISLKDYDPEWIRFTELKTFDRNSIRESAKEIIRKNIQGLSKAQDTLYASASQGVLIILQGMDASGKDGTIKHVMSGINPQGCQVYSFKEPTSEELSHHFLWRYARATPARGYVSIFNRSHYEDVVTVRVHPELLLKQGKRIGKKTWKDRYQDISIFEKSLARNGISVLKFFLHISKEEQKRRLLERLTIKEKHWKFSPSDYVERGYWKEYQKAYEEAITETSTPWAPWYIIPADYKWSARALIADVISDSIHALDLSPPKLTRERKNMLAAFRRKLEAEHSFH